MKAILSIIIFSFLIISNKVIAQSYISEERAVIESNPGGIIESFDLEKSTETQGSYYLNTEWQQGTIYLYDGRKIENMPLKYNLRDDFMHILDENEEIRVLKFDKIKSFEWFSIETKKYSKYVNCLDYDVEGTRLIGFSQMLSEGEIQLFRYKYLDLLKANYAITHDAGQKNDEYVIKDNRYIGVNGKLKVANKKKEVLLIMDDKRSEVENFIKKNRLNLKDDNHLIALIDYYITLL